MTGDRLAFLHARLDADEAVARATAWSPSTMTHNPWQAQPPQPGEDGWSVWSQGQYLKFRDLDETDAVHIAHNDPARALAEIKAKRQTLADADQLVAEFEAGADPYGTAGRRARLWRGTLHRNMAATYQEHPEYQPAWAHGES